LTDLFSFYQVIVERNGKIKLWCKGADSVINERLDPSCHDMQELTNHHLNVSDLQFVIFNLFIFCLFIKVANINQGENIPQYDIIWEQYCMGDHSYEILQLTELSFQIKI